MGRFSYESETETNPSVPTFFVALTGPKSFTAKDFVQIWKDKGISQKHARFDQAIDLDRPGYFQGSIVPIERKVSDTLFPVVYRRELSYRLSHWLGSSLPLDKTLWEVQVTSGPLGRSGAMSRAKTSCLEKTSSGISSKLSLIHI